MPFVNVPGLKGKVYVPQQAEGSVKKNLCPDCFSCQHCSDVRCGACLTRHTCRRSPLAANKKTTPAKSND